MRLFLSIAGIWMIGAGFMLMVRNRSGSRYSACEMIALPVFIGMGSVSMILLVYYLTGVGFGLRSFIVPPAAVFFMVAPLYLTRPAKCSQLLEPGVSDRRWTGLGKIFLALIVFQVLWVTFFAMSTPVSSHDAVANYALKSKIFHFSGGIPRGFFTVAEVTVAHPDYPLLLPFIMTWVYGFIGFNDLAVKAIMPLTYVSFMLVFFSGMKKLFGASSALIAVFMLATIPQLSNYATIIHADLLLSAFITCAVLYFMRYARQSGKEELLFCSILMGFSLWIKNEAIVLAGAFILSFAFFVVRGGSEGRKKRAYDMLLSVLIIAAIAAPWFTVKLSTGAVNSDIDLAALTFGRFMRNVKDIPVLLNLFQQEVFGPKKWNIFWVIFFASLIWKRRNLFGSDSVYAAVFLVIAAGGYFTGYMVTTGENLYFYVNTTISRFMLHFCGVSLILIWSLVHEDVKSTRPLITEHDQ